MNSLLLSLPGTPVLYYGDEIGMGDNFYLGDRHGVRTPMQWSGDRNAGFSRANPQRLFLPVIVDPEYHFESVNVEAQHGNPSSLLWWTRRLLALRKRHQAFGRGDFRWVEHANKRVLVFTRCFEQETILVVANLSRFAQAVELDLRAYDGAMPIELFGHTRFPAIGQLPYLLTLGPHTFFWFRLEPRRVEEPAGVAPGTAPAGARRDELPLLEVAGPWERVLDVQRAALGNRLMQWLPARRWFGGKGKTIRSIGFDLPLPVPLPEGGTAQLLVIKVEYVADDAERYLLPLAVSPAEERAHLHHRYPWSLLARISSAEGELLLHDAVASPAFAHALLGLMADGRRALGTGAQLVGIRHADAIDQAGALEPRPATTEQSNSSIVFGDRYILKLLRRVEEGESLDRELGLALTRSGFTATAEVVGSLELRWGGRRIATTGVLQRFCPNQGDAWEFALEGLDRYFERALAARADAPLPALPQGSLVRAAAEPIPEAVHRAIGEAYLHAAELLGRRTAELHRHLAAMDAPDFRSEPFTSLYQRSLYQSMRNLVGQTLEALGTGAPSAETDPAAAQLLARRGELLERFRAIVERRFGGERIRIHGDYHLGQVLWTGRDFVIIDFEGEPARPLSERRLRRSPLRDVAGMLRSFHYAELTALLRARERAPASAPERDALERWGRFWYRWVATAFLSGYLEAVGEARILPPDPDERQLLLDVFLLEKAMYELRYELRNRPEWVRIPTAGILELLGERRT